MLWNERFCKVLAQAGYYVIRFDNRDFGLPFKINVSVPDILQLMKDFTTDEQFIMKLIYVSMLN